MAPQTRLRSAALARLGRLARHVSVAPQVESSRPRAACAAGSELPSTRLLHGVRVLELATVVAAPSACAILADLGAEVLKVEHPDAPDYTRRWSARDDPEKTADRERLQFGVGSGFTQLNRGKRAIALNYQTPAGQRILKQLLAQTDVFVTNVRLKGLRKQGLDYASLAREFPRLIYGHLSAWGLSGPRQDEAGYDVGAFYAYTGLMELSRSSDEAPLPRYPAAFGDALTGTQLVAGVALALLHRHATGRGQLVDVSLMRAGVWAMSHPITAHAAGNSFAAGARPVIRGTTAPGERSTTITDGAFRCKDGRWVQLLGVESNRHWAKTVRALGLESKLSSDWSAVRKGTDWRAVTSLVDKVMATKTYEEWREIFASADVWHTPINRYEDMLGDEHANEAGCFADMPGLGHKLVRNPILLSSQEGKDGPAGRAPLLGEDTAAVLESLGYSPGQISELAKEGTVR